MSHNTINLPLPAPKSLQEEMGPYMLTEFLAWRNRLAQKQTTYHQKCITTFPTLRFTMQDGQWILTPANDNSAARQGHSVNTLDGEIATCKQRPKGHTLKKLCQDRNDAASQQNMWTGEAGRTQQVLHSMNEALDSAVMLYAKSTCREITDRVLGLPRELQDEVYKYLLNEQALKHIRYIAWPHQGLEWPMPHFLDPNFTDAEFVRELFLRGADMLRNQKSPERVYVKSEHLHEFLETDVRGFGKKPIDFVGQLYIDISLDHLKSADEENREMWDDIRKDWDTLQGLLESLIAIPQHRNRTLVIRFGHSYPSVPSFRLLGPWEVSLQAAHRAMPIIEQLRIKAKCTGEHKGFKEVQLIYNYCYEFDTDLEPYVGRTAEQLRDAIEGMYDEGFCSICGIWTTETSPCC